MKYPDTQFLRALGIILVTNSHLTDFYPIPYIGTGGAIGNCIFFSLSAFGIYLSQQKKNKPFSEWFKGRIGRIYPSIWLVLIFLKMPILLSQDALRADYITIFIGQFFAPPHWFIKALLVYYILIFFFLKHDRIKKLLNVFLGLSILYFVVYFNWVERSIWSVEDLPFKLIHYFMIFIFGIFLASRNNAIAYTGLYNYLVLLFFVALIYGHKFLMTKGLLPEFQFIQQAAMYPLVYYLLKISRAPFLLSALDKSKLVSSIVQFLSNHTLEIYIVQETIIHTVNELSFPFPLNVVIFIFFICILSVLVKRLAGKIWERVN